MALGLALEVYTVYFILHKIKRGTRQKMPITKPQKSL